MSAESERANEMEGAIFNLLLKFHRETDCGEDGMHWAECSRAVDACGWESWEAWKDLVARGPIA